MAPITDREQILLLSVFEAEAHMAEILADKWANTPDEGYVDGPEALAAERSFADGARLGANNALSMLRKVIDG